MNVVHAFVDAALSVPLSIWALIIVCGVLVWFAYEFAIAPIEDAKNARPTAPSRDVRGRRTGESPPLSPSSQKQRIRDAHAEWCGHRSSRSRPARSTATGTAPEVFDLPVPSGRATRAHRVRRPGSS